MSHDEGDASVKCSLVLEFADQNEAEKVHRSVELDNEGYVRSRVEGRTIIAEMEASSLKSLLHTLDDFLSCAGLAGNIVSKKR